MLFTTITTRCDNTVHNNNTLLENHDTTCMAEVTSSTDSLRSSASSFKKIKFKYLENGGGDNYHTTGQKLTTSNTPALGLWSNNTAVGVEGIVLSQENNYLRNTGSGEPPHSSRHKLLLQLGIKRKLSHSSCSSPESEEQTEIPRTLKKIAKNDEGDNGGLDHWNSSLLPSVSFPTTSYSPKTTTFPYSSCQPPPTTNTNGIVLTVSPSSSPKHRKLRIVHDRYNPFLIDSLLELILSYLSLSQLKTVALVSKRWHLFASNRLNQLMFFTPPYDLFSSSDSTDTLDGGDIEAAVCGLEKIKDVVNERLRRLSQIRRHRLTARFLLWRDNGQHKQATASPPPWAYWLLHTYGFPLSEFRTYTVDEVFHWIMNNYQMDDKCKEEWSSLIMESNVVAFVFRPGGR